MSSYLKDLAQKAKIAGRSLATLATARKNAVLISLADLLEEKKEDIFAANERDIVAAKEKNLPAPLLGRLKLDNTILATMCLGIKQIAAMTDPVGELEGFHYQNSGILVGKRRVPLGVVGMIYEARPNVTIDAFALCFKAGNAVVLRGGTEALGTNQVLAAMVQEALRQQEVDENSLCFVSKTDRKHVGEMLQAEGLIDVIIPRGGKSLVERVSREAKIPTIKHLEGICHIFWDEHLDIEEALKITINAKISKPSACNAVETLLVHKKIADKALPLLAEAFAKAGVELRVCDQARQWAPSLPIAREEDWQTEYLALILSIKVVDSLEAAIEHINHYGSHHTDAILTRDYKNARLFTEAIDSANVMINASTRFADGFEYGLGAEIGISTDKLHARGPVGLLGLTTEKWIVLGHGEIRP